MSLLLVLAGATGSKVPAPEAEAAPAPPLAPIPVTIWFDDFATVFSGTGTPSGGFRGGSVDVVDDSGEVRCVGPSNYRIVPVDADPPRRCDGIRGEARLSCSDGRLLDSDWWMEESCASGYGEGSDGDGHSFHLAFGGSSTRAEATARDAVARGSDKPPLPGPGSEKESQKAGDYSTGTAFFVTWEGHLLSSHHVVEGATNIRVKLGEDEFIDAKIVSEDLENDLVLLAVDAIRTPLPIDPITDLVKGQEVFTLGFPLVKLQGSEPKATFGRVNSLSGLQGDERYAQIDVPIQPGNSGGPLMDRRGEVVGIVSSMLHAQATLEMVGVVPQNVNYALKSPFADALLEKSLSADWQQVDRSPARRSFRELVSQAEASVVLVVAW